MKLRDRIATLVSALPEGGSANLPRSDLAVWLDEDSHTEEIVPSPDGYTVRDVARLKNRSIRTVRWWISSKQLAATLDGSSRHGYRISPEALVDFDGRQSSTPEPQAASSGRGGKHHGTPSLGTWRTIEGTT